MADGLAVGGQSAGELWRSGKSGALAAEGTGHTGIGTAGVSQLWSWSVLHRGRRVV